MENYAALPVLIHYLQVVLGHSAANCFGDGMHMASGLQRQKTVPFVLFGNAFPKDKKYTQVLFICVCVCACMSVRECVGVYVCVLVCVHSVRSFRFALGISVCM